MSLGFRYLIALGAVAFGCGCGADVITSGGAGGAGGEGGGATSSVGGAGGGGDLVATIKSANFIGNCKPVVGDDPLGGSVAVTYENRGHHPDVMTIASASLVFATAQEGWSFALTLDPNSSGTVAGGEIAGIEHVEGATPGDSSFLCQLCGMQGTLTMRWTRSDGVEQTANEAVDLSCTK